VAWQLILVSAVDEIGPRLGFVVLMGLSWLLDIFDGYLARRLGHTSRFGALFDLGLDLITITIVWTVSGFYLATAFIVLEWAAGLYIAAFSMLPQAHWKTIMVKGSPGPIKFYFSRNQRNPLSAYGNIAHFAFPLALYLGLSAVWPYYLLWPGLILYEAVTFYLLFALLKILIRDHHKKN